MTVLRDSIPGLLPVTVVFAGGEGRRNASRDTGENSRHAVQIVDTTRVMDLELGGQQGLQ